MQATTTEDVKAVGVLQQDVHAGLFEEAQAEPPGNRPGQGAGQAGHDALREEQHWHSAHDLHEPDGLGAAPELEVGDRLAAQRVCTEEESAIWMHITFRISARASRISALGPPGGAPAASPGAPCAGVARHRSKESERNSGSSCSYHFSPSDVGKPLPISTLRMFPTPTALSSSSRLISVSVRSSMAFWSIRVQRTCVSQRPHIAGALRKTVSHETLGKKSR
ncbi:unnamed protein product [Prorocentrum cordatum]|uniref:Uncharacterized protein n=1 Tax=Prorocentrum cordatum TaxID=2364126 RepID=A0ABN9VD52_9DINO|nr:unnamed protein product [Polarella glacialis]